MNYLIVTNQMFSCPQLQKWSRVAVGDVRLEQEVERVQRQEAVDQFAADCGFGRVLEAWHSLRLESGGHTGSL